MIPFLDCPQSDDRIILSLLRSYLHCARIIDTRTNHAPAHVIPLHQTYARTYYTPAPDVRPHRPYATHPPRARLTANGLPRGSVRFAAAKQPGFPAESRQVARGFIYRQ